MITSFTFNELVKANGGHVVGGQQVMSRVSTDSRKIEKGDCFVALSGERFDAHDFLAQVIDAGATGVVIQERSLSKLPANSSVDVWLVDDTVKALGDLARFQREQFTGPVFAITGSSGKTTVKGMIANILRKSAGEQAVCVTQGNYNNHIGVPLTLFQLEKNHQYAVIEMGASAVGEIQYLTGIAKPDIAMVNNVMPAHVEGFGSVDAIATAKGEIYNGLSESGIAVVNVDDHYANQWLSQNGSRKVIQYSVNKNQNPVTIFATKQTANKLGCYAFSLVCGEESVHINLQIPGKHNVANAVAAAACTFVAGISVANIQEGLNSFQNEPGRMQVKLGLNDSEVIDDSYNANPGSVAAAIDLLADREGSRILVLGDMGELGAESELLHQQVGRYAKDKKIDYLFALGEKSALAAKAFGHQENAFTDLDELLNQLTPMLNSQSIVLVKGSRSARMERVVTALQSTGEADARLAR